MMNQPRWNWYAKQRLKPVRWIDDGVVKLVEARVAPYTRLDFTNLPLLGEMRTMPGLPVRSFIIWT
jgi:hypothetical protein